LEATKTRDPDSYFIVQALDQIVFEVLVRVLVFTFLLLKVIVIFFTPIIIIRASIFLIFQFLIIFQAQAKVVCIFPFLVISTDLLEFY
jgi:hypothetical protein